MGDGDDVRQMSDPDFLAERARVRKSIEALQGRMAELSDEAALEDDDLVIRPSGPPGPPGGTDPPQVQRGLR
jgi:hypothetical protein